MGLLSPTSGRSGANVVNRDLGTIVARDLLPGSGGRFEDRVHVEVIRELTREDLSRKSAREAGVPPLRALRQAHHQLARLLAKGTPVVEVALVSGYDLEYIYSVQQNPTFQEILDHYRTIDYIAEADIKGQMTSTGQLALAELNRRLEEAPEDFSVTGLQTTVDLLLVQTRKGMPTAPSSAPSFHVQFVNSATPQLRDVVDVTKGEDGRWGDGEQNG